ncbi:MAG: SDR family oxidoreductase [Firmicutes bacterium]|nr:SDR family oxidoreductase [Bacillota bacterium]
MKRVAVITGATRGIGNGLFQRLAGKGCSVATFYHKDEESAKRFKRDAIRFGVECQIELLDIRQYDELDGFVKRVYENFGRIDYLVNNIGVDVFKTIYDTSFEEWKLSQDILLNAPLYLSKLVLPVMRAQQFGRIVNIGASSKDYLKGVPGIGPFGIHKAALTVFTKTLALEEIRNGITVNMVAPGSTESAGANAEERRIPITLIPIGRRVKIDEVVDAIMYFLSDNSNSVTGQVIGVNGGLST